jgi:outer membrane lipoprotein LolB
LLALACATLLAACAQPPSRPAAPVDGERFQLEGRLSVRQGEARHHVGISWRHVPAGDEILLSGPLGQGLAELTRDAGGARLVAADGQRLAAADWDSLAERAFGARLPLSAMPRWVVGAAPAPGSGGTDGWRIDYLEYDAGRPVLIEMRRDDIEVRLKVDAWSAPR